MTEQEWRESYLKPITNPTGFMLKVEANALVLKGLAALAQVNDIETDHHRCRLALRLLEAWEEEACAYKLRVRA